MLARRVIPCLDVDRGRVVKGTRFVGLRDAGDPVEAAARYDAEEADELVFLDIGASHEARDATLDMIRRVADTVFVPFTVGGGVRSLDDMARLLDAGADKVAINTAALARPELLAEGARRFGSQAIVVAIDARRASPTPDARRASPLPEGGGGEALRASPPPPSGFEVFTHGGRRGTGRCAVAWAREAVERGAGEVLLTSMDRDGTRDGYDLPLTRAVADAVRVPVIASGGAGAVEHLVAAVVEGRASAVLAASIFHWGELSIPDVKRALLARGVPVRAPSPAAGRARPQEAQ